MVLTCALAVVAEDVTFLANRRHWEQLPTSTLMQLGNDFILAGLYGCHINACFRLQSKEACLLNIFVQVGRVQEGLGRDAAMIQTGATQSFFFDQCRFHTRLRGIERGLIASRPRADDDQIIFFHTNLCLYRIADPVRKIRLKGQSSGQVFSPESLSYNGLLHPGGEFRIHSIRKKLRFPDPTFVD